MLQIILTLVIFVLLIIPIGRYMFHIATGQHTFCGPVFNRIDNGIYRICGINQNEGIDVSTGIFSDLEAIGHEGLRLSGSGPFDAFHIIYGGLSTLRHAQIAHLLPLAV